MLVATYVPNKNKEETPVASIFGTRPSFMNIKLKTALVLPVLAVVPIATAGLFPAIASADSLSTDFESFSAGTINGQNGWSALGSAGSGCAVYDEGVDSPSGTSGFGSKSFRISNAVTSGCFGDQVFAAPLANAVGESDSTDGSFSPGTLQRHFEMQFDLASANPSAQQPGLAVSVSPDRGDGSRMSYLRFEDGIDGLDVYFDDVQGTSNPANFVETEVGTGLNRSVPHTVKLTLDTLDGPSNDVVKVWIDGQLVHTGTSWENYYRDDSEASAEQSPRIVKTVLFRAGGTAAPATANKGFLVDNLSYSSGSIPANIPTHYDQCRKGGWKLFTDPSFKNQGKCMNYVWRHASDIDGDNVQYTAYGLNRKADFWASTALNRGHFRYSDANHDWYDVKVSDVSVNGGNGYFAGVVTRASNHAWVGNWLYTEVQDGHPDQIWGSFTSQTAAMDGVDNMSPSPADGPFSVTYGHISIRH